MRLTARLIAGVATLLLAFPAVAASPPSPAEPPPPGLTVDRVVMLLRHGVRPPTKALPLPAGVTHDAWPAWPVQPGWLTPNGAAAIGRIAAWDAARLQGQGLLPAHGCPAAGTVRVVADSDQRTIATAAAWLTVAAPGCNIPSEHKPQDVADPVFSALETGQGTLDPARATAEVTAAAGPGGFAALDSTYHDLLRRIDAVFCGAATTACGVSGKPTGLRPATSGQRPKLFGALDTASTAAQILLLEYADGKPLAEVGWGRATAADIGAFSAFHALEFRLLARPRAVAVPNFAGLAPIVTAGLTGPARMTLIVGHDTNVANLGGLLDAHWKVPGFSADDPTPGGAVLIERLSDGQGATYVRALYRSQTLEQIRNGTTTGAEQPYLAVMPIAGCSALGVRGLCTLAQFQQKLTATAD